ncbi:MAG: hypothetical protein ACLR06_07490 [Christensenellaceae bacterium]
MEAEHQEVVFPDYVMEEGMLSDFTDKSVKRLGGQDYHDAVPDKAGWDTNYHSFFRSGFVSADDARKVRRTAVINSNGILPRVCFIRRSCSVSETIFRLKVTTKWFSEFIFPKRLINRSASG